MQDSVVSEPSTCHTQLPHKLPAPCSYHVVWAQIFNEVETEFSVNNGPFWVANGWDTTRYSINGRSWGTLEGLEMNVGER